MTVVMKFEFLNLNYAGPYDFDPIWGKKGFALAICAKECTTPVDLRSLEYPSTIFK